MKQTGNVLTAMLPLLLIFVLTGGWLISVERGIYWSERIQIWVDQSLLSSLRVRAEGLQIISQKWESFGALLKSGDKGGVHVDSNKWDEIESKTKELATRLPGYKGRIISVMKAVSKANGFNGESLLIEKMNGLSLGITAEPVLGTDETGRTQVIPYGWYKREWNFDGMSGKFDDRARILGAGTVRPISFWRSGAVSLPWKIVNRTQGRLVWDADRESSWIQTHGNGGYPENWEGSLMGETLMPHRLPLFWAELNAREVKSEIEE